MRQFCLATSLLNAKSCQRGPGLAAIVISNLFGEDYGLDLTICSIHYSQL